MGSSLYDWSSTRSLRTVSISESTPIQLTQIQHVHCSNLLLLNDILVARLVISVVKIHNLVFSALFTYLLSLVVTDCPLFILGETVK